METAIITTDNYQLDQQRVTLQAYKMEAMY